MESLEEAFAAEGINLGTVARQPFTQKQMQQAVDILDATWRPVHEMLAGILKESESEIQVQQVLQNVQSMINMAGSARLESALAKIVEKLCSWEFPADLEERTWDEGYKHIYVFNAIFNTAQCLNKILSKEAWVSIFSFLQKVNACVNKQPLNPLELIRSNALTKRVMENLGRYMNKDEREGMPRVLQRVSEPLDKSMVVEADPFPTSEETKDARPLSGRRSPSAADLLEGAGEMRGLETPVPDAKPLIPNAYMNFYKLNNMLSKMEESAAKPEHLGSADSKGKKSSKGSLHNEMKSMKESIDYLFVYTTLFDQNTLTAFVGGLGDLTIQSLELASKGPEAKDARRVNAFTFLKLLETVVANISRIHYIWDYLDAHLEFLASLKIPALKALSIGSMTYLITSIFDYRKEKMWREIDYPKWSKNKWQTIVLSPLANSLFIGDPECTYEIIHNLRHIIENCGPYIVREGWEVILRIIESVISPIASSTTPSAYTVERTEQAFKCLEHICHNSLHKVHVLNFETLVAVIYHFTTLKGSLNTSLLAVAFLHNVADYVSQQQLMGRLKDFPEEKVNELWMKLLGKLKEIGMDRREELRSAAYRTLEQIMADHSSCLSTPVWTHALASLLPELLSFAERNYFALGSKSAERDGNKYEDQKNRKHAWEESIAVLYTSFGRAAKILYSLDGLAAQ